MPYTKRLKRKAGLILTSTTTFAFQKEIKPRQFAPDTSTFCL